MYDFTRRMRKVKQRRLTKDEMEELLKKQVVKEYRKSLKRRLEENK